MRDTRISRSLPQRKEAWVNILANIVYTAVSKFHPFSEPLILLSKECKEPGAYPRGTWGKSWDTKAS